MIKDVFYVELTKKDKMIYFLIGLLLILGFVFLLSWIKWIILVFLLFLLGYLKKDFLFSKKMNLMDKMVVVDENNNMYIFFNQKNMKVLKVLKVYSYSNDVYVLDGVSLRNPETKKSLSVTFSKKYKDYQQLISLVNSFVESGSSFEK